MKEKKLTPLHWCVYNYLLDNTQDGKTLLTQGEIYNHCQAKGHKVTWNEKQNQHNDHCRWLTKIVDEINYSVEVDKLIFHNGYRYCIASEEEAEVMIAKYDQRIKLASKRKTAMLYKMHRHDQGKLLTNRLEPMEGSRAKPFHDAYREEEQCSTRK